MMRELLNDTEKKLLEACGFDYYHEGKVAYRKVDESHFFTAVTWTPIGEDSVLWVRFNADAEDGLEETYAKSKSEIMTFIQKCLDNEIESVVGENS